MKRMNLTRGFSALVDDEDYPELSRFKWSASVDAHTVYAVRGFRRHGKLHMIKMHQQIMGFPEGDIDHRDGNGLNNQRGNLRCCSRSQNNANRRRSSRNKSGFKGVSWHKTRRKWRASIRSNRKQHHLGLFADPVEAARAYSEAAQRLFGDFANLDVNDQHRSHKFG